MESIGRTRWAIAEGFIPGKSHGPAPEMISHEACCILNASEKDAHVTITVFFEDRDRAGPYNFEIPSRRTRHRRFNNFSHGRVDRMKMSGRLLKGDRFIIHPEIPFIANLFVNVPETKIWLANPAPAAFLRWEGPIVLPTDPMIRVDLISGEKSGPAESAGS